MMPERERRLPGLCRRFLPALLAFVLLSGAAARADTLLDRARFAERLAGLQSSFLAVHLETGRRCRLSGSDLQSRHAPWSSFKIPNTLIALDTGIAAGPGDWRDWDRSRRPARSHWPDDWKQGQTLETAFRRSAVWYYRDLAEEIGAPRYRLYLEDWEYGNAAVPEGADDFWLGGPLALSVEDQARFLERLLTGGLGVPERHVATLARIARLGPLGDGMLHGKTGSGPVSGSFEGWFVGWLARDGSATSVFAHYVRGGSYAAIREFRRDFAEELLTACGLAAAHR